MDRRGDVRGSARLARSGGSSTTGANRSSTRCASRSSRPPRSSSRSRPQARIRSRGDRRVPREGGGERAALALLAEPSSHRRRRSLGGLHPRPTARGSSILAYRYAMKKTGLDVADPAKQRFSGFGNTDLFEDDHPQITDGQYGVGDLAHSGATCASAAKAGDASTSMWTSHGQESGPEARQLHRAGQSPPGYPPTPPTRT